MPGVAGEPTRHGKGVGPAMYSGHAWGGGPEGNIQLWVWRAVHCSSAPPFLICSTSPFF